MKSPAERASSIPLNASILTPSEVGGYLGQYFDIPDSDMAALLDSIHRIIDGYGYDLKTNPPVEYLLTPGTPPENEWFSEDSIQPLRLYVYLNEDRVGACAFLIYPIKSPQNAVNFKVIHVPHAVAA
jgi:hypothetical protein